jgi:ABC-type sugar transport system permease subunit
MENSNVQVKKGYYATRKRRQMWFLIALCIVPLINFAIFWVYVNFKTILLTFQQYDSSTASYEPIGLTRYISVFKDYVLGHDPAKQRMYINALRAIVINLIILPIAFIASYSFYKKIRFEKFFRVLFMFPSIISIVVLTMVFRYMFHGEFGPIAILAEKLTGEKVSWLSSDSDRLWPLIYTYAIWAGLGTNVIMISGAMLRIPGDITEACLIDGVGFWREACNLFCRSLCRRLGFISFLFCRPALHLLCNRC